MRRDLDLFRPWNQPARWNQRGGDVFSLFNDFLGGQSDITRGFTPTVDVDEEEDHFLMTVDLPGVKEEDLTVMVDGNQLTIRAERRDERSETKRNRNVSERFYGVFERTFALPYGTEVDEIETHFENGVLSVAIPKGESSKSRKLEIGKGKKGGGFLDRLLRGKSHAQDDEGGSSRRRAANE